MTGKGARNKGVKGERELEKLIQDKGIEVDRNLGGRLQVYGDMRIPGVAIECRRRERVSIVSWSRDHEADIPDHLIPVVAYRTNGEPWRVSMTMEDFLEMYQQSQM
jgi:Holliday junction resolvase